MEHSTEKNKTRQQRAEDVAYTLNHAVSCATTDMLIAPTISALFGVQVGCSDPAHDHHEHEHDAHEHNHEHDHGHHHEPVRRKGKLSWKLYTHEALHYLKGEVIGDLVAVPLTIGVQRFFPSWMDAIRSVIAPIASPFFRRGADGAAQRWSAQQGLPSDAPEVKAHAQALYDSEVQHLPQAVMWNMFAFPIGAIGQKLGGHATSMSRIVRNKFIGAAISNGLLLGGRAAAPDVAEKWDDFNSRHIVMPVTKAVGRLFGVEEDMLKQTAETRWKERVEERLSNPRERG